MDCRIEILPDQLVKQIAAGEVIDRPASVVKELLENAIDAQASRIAISVEDGGKQLIRATDNGCGMSPPELRLAVTPHATSKIRSQDDLFAIRTMGFRGEALASISSVSRLRIISRPNDSIEGHEVCVVGDELQACRAAGCPAGTTVEVRDLFFNVPARRKFLRAHATEMGRIHEQFTRIALAFPSVGFELNSNGRQTHQLPACTNVSERIARLFSPELAGALLSVRRMERGVELEAYVAPPSASRATPQWQFTFVNGRCIRDRFLQHAIKEAYRGLMEPQRHGVAFVFLRLDPSQLDVNVHPTKIEVRWADAQLIHSQVLSAIRETFQRADLIPRFHHRSQPPVVDEAEQDRIRLEVAAVLKSTEPIRPTPRGEPFGDAWPTGVPSAPLAGPPVPADTPHVPSRSATPSEARAIWQALYGHDDSNFAAITDSAVKGQQPSEAPSVPFAANLEMRTGQPVKPPSRAIQMHNLYLVAECEDGIIIVDQHALHERVIYEQLRRRLSAGPLEAQRLLLPETIRVTPKQLALMETRQDLLVALGIEWSPFGVDSVALHTFPVVLKDTQVNPFMQDMLDRLEQNDATTPPDVVLDGLLSMMACKAAVKAGDPLNSEEIEALFQQRELADKASSCPHGRPTTLRLTKAELDRQFKRT